MSHTMGNRSEAGIKVTEVAQETWMDRLMTLTLNGRHRPEALTSGELWQLDHTDCDCGVHQSA